MQAQHVYVLCKCARLHSTKSVVRVCGAVAGRWRVAASTCVLVFGEAGAEAQDEERFRGAALLSSAASNDEEAAGPRAAASVPLAGPARLQLPSSTQLSVRVRRCRMVTSSALRGESSWWMRPPAEAG